MQNRKSGSVVIKIARINIKQVINISSIPRPTFGDKHQRFMKKKKQNSMQFRTFGRCWKTRRNPICVMQYSIRFLPLTLLYI